MADTGPSVDLDRYLSATQTCQLLGDISQMTLWRWLREFPDFPRPYRVVRKRYWRASELHDWMAERLETT